ncbi:MAG: site-specific integrase, partial [Tepidisphaeraceae bacterium]
LQQLFDRYKSEHLDIRCTAKTVSTDVSRFNSHLSPLANRRVLSITSAEISALHLRIGRDPEAGKITANRTMELLRRLYNWSKLGVNPAANTWERFEESERERFAQPDELGRLFKAMEGEDINPDVRDYLKLALFSGARRSNLLAMRMEEINLAAAVWTIPGKTSKNRKPMVIPLTPPALEIIKRRWGDASGFIFPSTWSASGHLENPRKVWETILERAELTDLRLHDLRRTFGSFQAGLNASLPIIGRSLGHRSTKATMVYSRVNLDTVRSSVTLAVDAIVAAGGGVA